MDIFSHIGNEEIRMADITAIILTRNEEENIKACIDSIQGVVSRLVVVDSYSADKTEEVARSCGAEVYKNEFFNYAKQYKYAVDIAQVKTVWILRIDADERLTEESAEELEHLCNVNTNTDVEGIILRFCNEFMGKSLKHGMHYPWKKLIVYKTGKGDIEDRYMDEHIVLNGTKKIVEAKRDSLHLAYRGLDYLVNKCNWYSTREVMDYYDEKDLRSDNTSIRTWIKMSIYYKLPMGLRSWAFYIYCYYIRLGFLDGREGKIYAVIKAYWYRFLVDAKIYEHEKLKKELKPTGALNDMSNPGNWHGDRKNGNVEDVGIGGGGIKERLG